MINHIIRVVVFIFFAVATLMGLNHSDALTQTGNVVPALPAKWHPVTISFTGPAANEDDTDPNPFLDYRLQVEFTSPNGRLLTVPGFFDGDGNGSGSGNVWRVRFSPDEVGTWNYVASFREGNNIAIDTAHNAGNASTFIDGSSGQFTVTALDNNAAGFLKWGRLEYVGKHYLKFQDGNYWLKGGADSPENFLGYKGFDNTVNQSGGAGTSGLENGLHRYQAHTSDWTIDDPNFVSADTGYDGKGIIGALNYLSNQHVNSIYFLPMNLGGDGRETYPFISPSGSNTANTQYDISKLHQWNMVLNHAQEKGIALHFVLAETEIGNEEWLDNGSLGVERKLYYRELIARFSYLLALKWNLSEENDFSIANLQAFADYIVALDWAQHPITVHTKPNNFSDYNTLVGDSRFKTTSIQYNPDLAGAHVEEWRTNSTATGQPWVIDMDENNPAGTGLTDSNANDLRKRVLYDVYFSGGNIEWYFGYHDLPLGGDMRTEDFSTREDMWEYMWYARQFMMDNLPFWEMVPADWLLTGEHSGFGGGELFYKPGHVYALYLPNASTSGTVDLSSISGNAFIRWFNPRTGNFEGSTQTVVASSTIALGTPPSSSGQDWVILVEAETPTDPPPDDGIRVTNLTLIDADSDSDLFALADGATVNLATTTSTSFNIRADATTETNSVRFNWAGNANFQTENNPPYALFGDSSGDYNGQTLSLGNHNLIATPYSQNNAGGAVGEALAMTFAVRNNADLQLTIGTDSSDVVLSWTDIAPTAVYEVWRAAEPYLVPGTDGEKIVELTAATYGEPQSTTDENVLGQAAAYYYKIRVRTSGGSFVLRSSPVGVFEFEVQSGG